MINDTWNFILYYVLDTQPWKNLLDDYVMGYGSIIQYVDTYTSVIIKLIL